MDKLKLSIVFSTFLATVFFASCSSHDQEPIPDWRYFSLKSSASDLEITMIEGDVEFNIDDKELHDALFEKYYSKCFSYFERQSPYQSNYPADCPKPSVWEYHGKLNKKEFEPFQTYINVDRLRYYVESACDEKKGCLTNRILADSPNRLILWSLPDAHHLWGTYFSWASVDRIQDRYLKEFVERAQDLKAKKIALYRKKNAEELRRLGITLP